MAHGDPKLGQKMVNFRGFSKKNFRTTGFELKFLIFLIFPNIFLWKLVEKIKVGMVLGQNMGQLGPLL